MRRDLKARRSSEAIARADVGTEDAPPHLPPALLPPLSHLILRELSRSVGRSRGGVCLFLDHTCHVERAPIPRL